MRNKKGFLSILIFLLVLLTGCGLLGDFEPIKYTLELEIIGEGYVDSPEGLIQNTNEFEAGTLLYLHPSPEDGWFFSHWENDLQGSNNPIELTMDENKSVTVVFLEQGQAWRYLYEGEHRIDKYNAIGLDEQGKWQAAVIIDPESGDEFITRVSFYDAFAGAKVTPKIFGADSTDEPGDELWAYNNEYETKNAGWVEFVLPEKIEIGGYDYYWIIFEVDDPGEGYHPMGVAEGPQVEDKNKINNVKEDIWKNLIEEDEGFDFNWLINILVEY